MKKYCIISLFLFMSISTFSQKIDYEKVKKDFSADTARVEQTLRNAIDVDYSTMGMVEATINYESQYDELLNKYYKVLLNSLDEKDKEVLKTTQRNWIKLRDSDKELTEVLCRNAYDESGGGTIWRLISVGAKVEITRKRVFELYDFLMLGYIGG